MDGGDHTGRRLRTVLARLMVRGVAAAVRWGERLLPPSERARLSGAELRTAVAHSTGLDRMERQLIDDVLDAGDRHVRELMVPRTEVVFLDAGMSVTEAARFAAATRHSRFPVMDATRDDVLGFVHLRDLLIRPDGAPELTVGQLAREVHRLPGSKRVLAALSDMRRAGDHLALIEDEYGGTAGIVTLEDLIEELVGEIHDEYDAAPEPAGATPADLDGLLNLNDFADRTGHELPTGPYDTVGGYVMATLGRLPVVGDRVAIPATGWQLTVAELDGRRVSRLTLDAPPAPVAEAPAVDLVLDLTPAPA